jgi:hypothetical protein
VPGGRWPVAGGVVEAGDLAAGEVVAAAVDPSSSAPTMFGRGIVPTASST